jgi:uncharacterized protein
MKLKKVLEEKYRIILIITLSVVICALCGWLLFTQYINSELTLTNTTITDNSITKATHINSGSSLLLEVAASIQKREQGLMNREKLEENTGMLFIFPSERPLTFWMKDTSIPLDMIFLDKNKKVTTIFSNTETNQIAKTYSSKTDSMYVIETIAGWTKDNGIDVGDYFELEGTN